MNTWNDADHDDEEEDDDGMMKKPGSVTGNRI